MADRLYVRTDRRGAIQITDSPQLGHVVMAVGPRQWQFLDTLSAHDSRGAIRKALHAGLFGAAEDWRRRTLWAV